ncbi:pickpocket protein 28-like [Daphnia carinata]|uniref:pickpocket protein 28-like n=1 Tax=Daphnia carinata TaxID=120202 RepID=UPI00257EB952|nr:pickpocket protein 28-like [Daphnia carinata]
MSRQRWKNNKKLLPAEHKIFQQFCEHSSLHGLNHIFEEGSLLFERIVWFLVFLSGVCFSGYFCWQMWQKWEQSPLLTSVETHLYPLRNTHFPAVTICNVNKVSERKLYSAILDNPKFMNVSYIKLQSTLRYMTKLDRAINNEEELLRLSRYYEARNISALDLFRILKKTAPSCSDMVLDCSWLGLTEPCMHYFSFLPTDDGMCCTFNGGNYFDTILDIDSKPRHEPLQVSGNGYRMGLTLVLDADLDDTSVTSGKFDGFKVLLHSPEEFPDVSHRGFVIGLGTETFVAVKATTSFYADEVARQVSPNKRQCYVEGEKKLKYFQRYSRSACSVECDTQMMEDRCHCRPFFFKGDNRTKLCEINAYSCISEVYEDIHSRGDYCGEVCNCLPPCSDTWYEPEISYASFPGRGFNRTRTFKRIVARHSLNPGSETKEYLKSNVAMLHVYYKEQTGMRYRTDIRYGIEDFISAAGGLLGLGLGMSFISVIEIIYYLFYRRLFLWLRSNWPKYRQSSTKSRTSIVPPYPVESAKFKKSPPSSPTAKPSTPSVWYLSLDGHSQLVRRGSNNLPAQIKARFSNIN